MAGPLDFLLNPTGAAEDTARQWFQTPAVKAGLGASLLIAAGVILFAKFNAGHVRSLSERYAGTVLPFAL